MLMFLIFALIIVSGLIAYIGDQIGMKVGKKRLSIFGIRPKYTSIIVTIMTGILIATISITLLMFASEGVRMAVFDMQGLLSRLNDLNTRLAITTKDLEAKDSDLENKDKQLQEKEIAIAQTTIELDKIRIDRDSLKADLDKIEAEYSDLKELLNKTRYQYDDLAKSKTDLEEVTKTLQSKIEELESQKANLEEESVALEKDVDTLQGELDDLTTEMKELAYTAAINILQSKYNVDQYQNKDIVFRKGDTVYVETLDTIPNGTNEDGEKALEAFLARANNHVNRLNLRKEQNNGRSIKFENVDDLLQIVRQLLDNSNEKILVAIYAAKNILIDEYLSANIEWMPNYMVFQENEVIYEKTIDSGLDPGDIFTEIGNILNKISDIAKKREMLQDESGSVGTLGYGDFYNITQNIKNYSGTVKIIVQASQNIWRDDVLSTENMIFKTIGAGENQ